MKRSESIKELAAALAKAQTQFESAERDHTAKVETRTGGSYSFDYADLAAYLSVCRKPLGDNGLSYLQEPIVRDRSVSVTTLLMHASGEWIESEPLTLDLLGQGTPPVVTPQVVGSAITYARRYSLSALTGMASEADDDGNLASGNRADTAKREPREALPECPVCKSNKSTIVGKPEFGGGFVCYGKKNGGCGYKWHADSAPADEGHGDAYEGPDSTPASARAITRAEWDELCQFAESKGCSKKRILEEFHFTKPSEMTLTHLQEAKRRINARDPSILMPAAAS